MYSLIKHSRSYRATLEIVYNSHYTLLYRVPTATLSCPYRYFIVSLHIVQNGFTSGAKFLNKFNNLMWRCGPLLTQAARLIIDSAPLLRLTVTIKVFRAPISA
jgi:hypothetical protein